MNSNSRHAHGTGSPHRESPRTSDMQPETIESIDVSVVLNMHREAPYLRATLLSFNACATTAQEAGLRCELVAVFDRPDEATVNVFNAHQMQGFESISIVNVDVGSLGLARNAGIDAAQGEYIWTADGDDLVSRNCIVELHCTASSHVGKDTVIFLNYYIGFGEKTYVAKYFDGSFITIADLVYQHCYVSRIFVRRNIFSRVRYQDLSISSGYAYEDWDFNLQLWYLGVQFLIAPNTVLFYRQRQDSLARQAHSQTVGMIPHSQALEPSCFVERLENELRAVGDLNQFSRRRRKLFQNSYSVEIARSPELFNYLIEASQTDPEIEPPKVVVAENYTPVPWHADHWGYRLSQIYGLIGYKKFTDVILLPWLNPGGGEKFILRVVQELSAAVPDANFLVLMGEKSKSHKWVDKLPPHCTVVDVFNAFPTLTVEDRDRLTARLLLAGALPGARLHIKTSIFAHRILDTFGTVLLRHFKGIYYRFCDDVTLWNGRRTESSYTLRFLRKHSSLLHKVICDCRYILENDRLRIGRDCRNYVTLRCKTENIRLTAPGEKPQHRLLWASRICDQKRPQLIGEILGLAQRSIPGLQIDVYGHSDIDNHEQIFDFVGVNYCGPFANVETIPIEKYDALLYTSLFDGLPNIILEVMGAGLPVIAPEIGGIPEVVIPGKTGFLVKDSPNDSTMVAAYAAAIRQLYSVWGEMRSISSSAHQIVTDMCGPEKFSISVRSVFELR